MDMMLQNAVSPYTEMVSYETMWGVQKASLKSMAELFGKYPILPSQLLEANRSLFPDELDELRDKVDRFLSPLRGFSVSINGCFQYPKKIRDAKYPPELLYYRGDIGLIESPCVSIVGTRDATPEGKRRAEKISRSFVEAGYTVVSGLAAGIDAVAMKAAIDAGGRTIGVIGTPINEAYPKENRDLQEVVAKSHLLISQVPFYRYANEPFQSKKRYFPERNETMAALSMATIIVEASDTSGTLIQARACVQQGRKLFILNSCFERPGLKWPSTYLERGAIRVRDFEGIIRVLGEHNNDGAVEED